MLSILSDAEIDALIQEPKVVPNGLRATRMIDREKHQRKDFPVASASATGNEFVLALRQSTLDPTNFSAILGYKVPGSTTIFRLRRYNGKHRHTNPIERRPHSIRETVVAPGLNWGVLSRSMATVTSTLAFSGGRTSVDIEIRSILP